MCYVTGTKNSDYDSHPIPGKRGPHGKPLHHPYRSSTDERATEVSRARATEQAGQTSAEDTLSGT